MTNIATMDASSFFKGLSPSPNNQLSGRGPERRSNHEATFEALGPLQRRVRRAPYTPSNRLHPRHHRPRPTDAQASRYAPVSPRATAGSHSGARTNPSPSPAGRRPPTGASRDRDFRTTSPPHRRHGAIASPPVRPRPAYRERDGLGAGWPVVRASGSKCLAFTRGG